MQPWIVTKLVLMALQCTATALALVHAIAVKLICKNVIVLWGQSTNVAATTSLCNKTIELLLWCYYITIKDGKGILQVGLNMIHVFFLFF